MLVFFILIQIIGSSTLHLNANADTDVNPDQEPCKILFIGASYFSYNNLSGLFDNLAQNADKDVYIDRCTMLGYYLSDHAKSGSTELTINSTNWDYVILQGVGSLTAYPENFTDNPVLPSLITLRDKIHDNNASTKIIFCLPWAFEDGMTWLGWADTYEDMQLKIYENTLQYSEEVGFSIAPVGWAWNTVLKEKNYPLHYLHREDWNHPTLEGSYLMACTIFSSIFREKSLGISYYSDLTRSDARYFQTVASDTVLIDLDLWNLDPPLPNDSDSISGFSVSSLFLCIILGLSLFILSQRRKNSKSL